MDQYTGPSTDADHQQVVFDGIQGLCEAIIRGIKSPYNAWYNNPDKSNHQ